MIATIICHILRLIRVQNYHTHGREAGRYAASKKRTIRKGHRHPSRPQLVRVGHNFNLWIAKQGASYSTKCSRHSPSGPSTLYHSTTVPQFGQRVDRSPGRADDLLGFAHSLSNFSIAAYCWILLLTRSSGCALQVPVRVQERAELEQVLSISSDHGPPSIR